MDIRITCENCGNNYTIPEGKYRGKPSRFTCKNCHQEIFLLPGKEGMQVTGGTLRSPFEPDTIHRLGKFKDLKRLATGGMGEIFLATMAGAEGFEKRVALKVLHPHLTRDKAFAKAMVDEAKITVLLNHPNIVHMYNLERVGDLLFCVMEYVPGKSLAAIQRVYRRKNGSIPLNMAAYVVSEALEGLAYAHELTDGDGDPLKIVHRDISPHNIMVTEDGWVKIIDFGIAKAARRITQTLPGTIKGKFAYMAPEQLKGSSDHRADIFAMGVVLWETLTGVRLFHSNTDVDTLQRVLHLEPPPITMSRQEIPKRIDKVLAKALAKAPDERYASARDFKADLLEAVKPATLADLKAAVDIAAAELGGVSADVEAADDLDDVTPAWQAKDVYEATTRVERAMAYDSPAARLRSSRWLWIGLTVVLLAGLGTAGWFGFARRGGSEQTAPDEKQTVASPSSGESTHGAAPPARGDPTPEQAHPAKPSPARAKTLPSA